MFCDWDRGQGICLSSYLFAENLIIDSMSFFLEEEEEEEEKRRDWTDFLLQASKQASRRGSQL